MSLIYRLARYGFEVCLSFLTDPNSIVFLWQLLTVLLIGIIIYLNIVLRGMKRFQAKEN